MLRELSIKNFAIIDDLHIRFSEGMTLFSGETGAGKSIIINAVNLILGGRASAKLIRTGNESAELEAFFEVAPESTTAKQMIESGYQVEEGLLIRRIISRKSRHRIYINGALASIQILSRITENLASISGQRAHQGLLKEERHLMVLDHFGGLLPVRRKVKACYDQMIPLIEKLSRLKAGRAHQDERRELLGFQKHEIEAASPSPGEDSVLEIEIRRLKNTLDLNQTVFSALQTLYDGRGAVIEQLMAVQGDVEKAAEKDPSLLPVSDSITRTAIQTEEVVDALRSYQSSLQFDEQHLDALEERQDILNRLKRKYGGSIDAVMAFLDCISNELSEMNDASGQIKKIEKDLDGLKTTLTQTAQSLSDRRKEAAARLSGKVVSELDALKMPSAGYEVSLAPERAVNDANPYLTINGVSISETGLDRAKFLIAPNVGEEMKPLAAIASGGELSRVVLALKAILADTDSVETVVFDEVDAGIGGGVAEVVGRKLQHLSRYHQVICITHLPQIARFGDHHFNVSKGVSNGRTLTRIRALEKEERVEEVARMLGGERITPTTRAHARELLSAP